MADCRNIVLEELHALISRQRPNAVYKLVLDYPLRAAKALRPAICIAACRALGGTLSSVAATAMTLELYHNAFLIHDDVEDGSEKRRDVTTLHRAHGVPIAVNVGDMMLALALEPLLDNMRQLSVGKALRILQLIAHMARESAEGQALELAFTREGRWDLRDLDYMRMIHKKTTVYSFITPAVAGAIIAGAVQRQLYALRLFATALGAAFQIQDDVLNLVANEHDYGKEIEGDLWEGKQSLILMHALRSAPPCDRAHAVEILAKARPHPSGAADAGVQLRTESDVRFLRSLIDRYHSIRYARCIAEKLALRAAKSLHEMTWMPPSVHREFLAQLVRFVVIRKH